MYYLLTHKKIRFEVRKVFTLVLSLQSKFSFKLLIKQRILNGRGIFGRFDWYTKRNNRHAFLKRKQWDILNHF